MNKGDATPHSRRLTLVLCDFPRKAKAICDKECRLGSVGTRSHLASPSEIASVPQLPQINASLFQYCFENSIFKPPLYKKVNEQGG